MVHAKPNIYKYWYQKMSFKMTGTYTTLVSLINKCSEIFHPALCVWILEEHTANILPTEVHLMRKLENGLHANVTMGHKHFTRIG